MVCCYPPKLKVVPEAPSGPAFAAPPELLPIREQSGCDVRDFKKLSDIRGTCNWVTVDGGSTIQVEKPGVAPSSTHVLWG